MPIRPDNLMSVDLNPSDDRRRIGRLRSTAVTCQLGEVINLSATGIQIRAKRSSQVPVGESVMLHICYRDHRVDVRARVAWVKKEWWNRPIMGLSFIDMFPETMAKLRQLALASAVSTTMGSSPTA